MVDAVWMVGDLHLGRQPGRLRRFAAELGVPLSAWSPTAALRALVEQARVARPAAVCFAGDVVDAASDAFEAFGALRGAAEQLLAAGVQVIAVAGNHDGTVLPRLADQLPAVRLLGRGGRWEVQDVGPLKVLGWSFPQAHVSVDPTSQPDFAEALAALQGPAVGLVHGDLGVARSRYAPLSTARMQAAGLLGWFVGHVHQPGLAPGLYGAGEVMGYLGSVVGLDRGEPGWRGVWAVAPEGDGLRLRQVDVAPLAWQTLEVRVPAQVADVVALRRHVERLLEQQVQAAPVVAWTLRLQGRVDDPRLGAALAAELGQLPVVTRAGARRDLWLKVDDQLERAIDLQELAARPGPAGRVAAHLLRLQSPSDDLVAERMRVWKSRHRDWDDLASVDEEAMRASMKAAAWKVLDDLLRQVEAR